MQLANNLRSSNAILTPTDDTFSQRLEQKFVVNRFELDSLMKGAGKKFFEQFEKSYVHDNCDYNIIDNVYFDTPDLTAYHQSIEQQEERMKLRIRQYCPNGMREDFIFFEQKESINGTTHKRRMQMRQEWLGDLLKGRSIPISELLALNEDKKEALQLYDNLQDYLLLKNYSPSLSSSYHRHAYRSKESKKIRLTVDTNLEFKRLKDLGRLRYPYAGTYLKDSAIIELKISSPQYFDTFQQLAAVVGAARSFSKYCYGVFSTR